MIWTVNGQLLSRKHKTFWNVDVSVLKVSVYTVYLENYLCLMIWALLPSCGRSCTCHLFFTHFLIFFVSAYSSGLVPLQSFSIWPFRSQMSCLMFAAKSGYSKVINLLMSYGAEINAQDDYGYTVSHYFSSSHCILSGINYFFPPSGFVYSSATQQTGGSAQAPSARSRQNLNHQSWQVPCWLGCNHKKPAGTFSYFDAFQKCIPLFQNDEFEEPHLYDEFFSGSNVGSISWNGQGRSASANLRSQMGKILASSPMSQASDSMGDTRSQFFMTNSEAPSAKEW